MSTSMDEAKEILNEMGICPKCHDHTPCGCEIVCDACGSENSDTELSHNNDKCFNCNTEL